MLERVRHRLAEMILGRGFEAAAGGRRWQGTLPFTTTNSALATGGHAVRTRATAAARNNAHGARAVAAWASNLVGTGIVPQSQHRDKSRRAGVEDVWRRFADECDPAGAADFYGQQALIARGLIEAGEGLARLRPRRLDDGLAVPLQVQILAGDQLPLDLDRLDPRTVAGVEFDRIGRRVAYHLYRERPGEGASGFETVRVPAEDVLHVYEALEAGQVRGVSWFAPVLTRLHELDQLQDATLVKQKVAALLAGLIVDPNGGGGGLADKALGGGLAEAGLEPGSLHVLPPGRDVRFTAPPSTNDYPSFNKAELRAVAVGLGLGLPYELLAGDLEGVTYSSIRQGLLDFRRRAEQVQHLTLVRQFCRPVWRRVMATAVLAGALPPDDPAELERVAWTPPAWPWVDPLKDVQAARQAIEGGITSRKRVAAERGHDVEELDAERAEDAGREAGLSLSETAA